LRPGEVGKSTLIGDDDERKQKERGVGKRGGGQGQRGSIGLKRQ